MYCLAVIFVTQIHLIIIVSVYKFTKRHGNEFCILISVPFIFFSFFIFRFYPAVVYHHCGTIYLHRWV
jgi:hypothetical protein